MSLNHEDKSFVDDDLRLVPLHKFPEYKEECMLILNKQWPRSETLRYRSLNSSCDKLPTSLVLIKKKNSNEDKVLGHARINYIPNEKDAVWIESVIIHHNKRGCGYGSKLMRKTEQYAITLGFQNAVLSTHGEEKFYEKLGYSFCSPISLYGGVVSKLFLPKPSISPKNNYDLDTEKDLSGEFKSLNVNCSSNDFKGTGIPPPPPLKLKRPSIQRLDGKNSKIYMRKKL